MLISIVIPAHNAAGYIDAQLSALEQQVDSGSFEVIVVNNMSADATAKLACQHGSQLDLRVIEATQGRSAPYARNVGVRAARGEFIVFVDADDVADSSLLAAYRRYTDSYRVIGGHYEETLLNDPRVAAWRYQVTRDGLPRAFGTVPFFLMGNVAIHRSLFDDLGGFDETLTHGGEEVDYSARLLLAGYEIGWAPDAIIHYRHRTTLAGLSRQFYDFGRATTYVYARYRKQLSLPPTTFQKTAMAMWQVGPHLVDLVRGNARRGEWVRLSSFYAGEAVESFRQRVWHLG